MTERRERMDRSRLLEDMSLQCDCTRPLEFTGRNVGGYDIYRCPQCEREGRQKRYRLPEDAANFAEYRDRVDAVYTKIDMRRGERAEWEDEIIRIGGDYSYAAIDPQFILLEMACYTNNFRDPLDLRSNFNYVNDRYESLVRANHQNTFPLNQNGVTMFTSCKRWLEKDMERSEYDRLVRDIYNRSRSCESRKQSRDNFKSDVEKLLSLDTIHNDFTKDDPVYHLAYVIVHTQNFRRRLLTNSRHYLKIADECNMIKHDLIINLDSDDRVVLSECERWLEAQKIPKWIPITGIVLASVIVVTSVLLGTFLTAKERDEDTGIAVSIPFTASDAFHRYFVSFNASRIDEGTKEYSTAATLLKKESEKFEIYDLTMMSGDKATKLTGNVEVDIPVPDDYFSKNIAVYYISKEGSCQLLESDIVELDGRLYVRFKTDHFSLYAITERPFHVSFYNKFSNGNIPDQTAMWGDPITEPQVYEEEGYIFEGWYDGVTKWDFDGGVVVSDLNLVAKWTPVKCSIRLNDGTSTSEYVTTYGEEYDLPVPTREGYTFLGWFDLQGKKYDKGVWYGLSNIELTASWQANHYSVSFDMNLPDATDGGSYKGTAMGNMMVLECEYDEKYTLPVNDFKVQGFVFCGWAIKSNGAATYSDIATISNLTGNHNETVVLYAVWKVDIFNIGKYVGNSTIVSDTDGESTYVVYNSPKDNTAIAHGGKAILDWSAWNSGSYDHRATTGKGLEIAGAEEIYVLGSSNVVYKNLYVDFSDYGENDNVTLHLYNFNMTGRIIAETGSEPKTLTIDSINDNSIKANDNECAISCVSEVEIVGEGNLAISGGNGSSATSSSGKGNHGRPAIEADKLIVSFKGKLTLTGGSGGHGADGNSYNTTPNPQGQASAGRDGYSGTSGSNGGAGGAGGNGAAALSVKNLSVISVTEMVCTGGNGGDGANGGRGQNGGRGGKGGNTTGQDGSDAGDGGRGGNGGEGGKGGDSGIGAPGIAIENIDDLKSCANLSLIHGYSGNAGSGGRGGDAGSGGDGGDDEHGGGFLGWGEGPEEGSGGYPGTPGKGGSAGAVITNVIKYNIPGVNEVVTTNPNPKAPTSGSGGNGGGYGSAGDNGFK
jgi:uncharacterized repeat protein (TIGR02543 family)